MSNGFYIDINGQKIRIYPTTLEEDAQIWIWPNFNDSFKPIYPNTYFESLPEIQDFSGILALPKRTKLTSPGTATKKRTYNYYYTNKAWTDTNYTFGYWESRSQTEIPVEIVPYRPVIDNLYFMIDNSAPPARVKLTGVNLDRQNYKTTGQIIGKATYFPVQKESIGYTQGASIIGPTQVGIIYTVRTNVANVSDIGYTFHSVEQGDEYLTSEEQLRVYKEGGVVYIEFYCTVDTTRHANKVKVMIRWAEYMPMDAYDDIWLYGNESSELYKTLGRINNSDFGPCGNGQDREIEIYLSTKHRYTSSSNYDIYLPLKLTFANGGNYIILSAENNKMSVRNPLTGITQEVKVYTSSPIQWNNTGKWYVKLVWGYNPETGQPGEAHFEWTTAIIYPTDIPTPF